MTSPWLRLTLGPQSSQAAVMRARLDAQREAEKALADSTPEPVADDAPSAEVAS